MVLATGSGRYAHGRHALTLTTFQDKTTTVSHGRHDTEALRHAFKWYSATSTLAVSRMMSLSMRTFRPCSWCAMS